MHPLRCRLSPWRNFRESKVNGLKGRGMQAQRSNEAEDRQHTPQIDLVDQVLRVKLANGLKVER